MAFAIYLRLPRPFLVLVFGEAEFTMSFLTQQSVRMVL